MSAASGTATRSAPAWLDEAAWLDEPDRGTLTVVDEAVLGPVRLLILAGAGGRRYFAPTLADGADACKDASFDRAVVDAMRARLTLPTRAGHHIEFHGTPAAYAGPLPFDPGWSSNALSLVDLAGVAHAHKTFRRITPGSREPELLTAMRDSGKTQQPVGDYRYRDTGGPVPLGMIYAYAEGDGLDVPLRQSLRALWPAVAAGAFGRTAAAAVTADLAGPMSEAGRFLRAFHDDLTARVGTAGPFPAAAFLAEIRDRIREVALAVRADDRHPVAVRTAVVDALHAEYARGSAIRGRWPSGAVHGDLHLSHFLRAEQPDGSWRMCLIDLSTPPLDPADPRHAAQSPWQDPVALLRGLACFTADELAYRAGTDLGLDAADVCRTLLLGAARQAPDAAVWTDARLAHLDALRGAAAAWQQRIALLLLRGYAPGRSPAGEPVWRLLRLHRLLHELAYAYAHDRAYYAAITLRHALEIAADHRPRPGSGS